MVGIEAFKLSKTYEGVKIGEKSRPEEKVRDVSFTVFENEVMGILGPSGAGKSSIFKMLTMAMSRSGGSIELIGRSFEGKSTSKLLTLGSIGIVY